jgi:addiction module HigA family antidote
MKMTTLLDEIHPGEILLEAFMRPMGITGRQLAADIDVSPSRVSAIVNGSRSMTADTALRLGLFFSMEPRFWMNLQAEYDLRMMRRHREAKIALKVRVHQMASA